MNALLATYSASSEDEDSVVHKKNNSVSVTANVSETQVKRRKLVEPALPRSVAQPVSSVSVPYAAADLTQFSVRGAKPDRYVSKRERAAAAASLVDSTEPSHASPVHPKPGVKDFLNAEIPYYIQKKLQNIVPDAVNYNRLPRGRVFQLKGHSKGVNSVRWSPTHASLLASAGMDQVALVWNVWTESGQQLVQRLGSYTAAVRDIQWSVDGKSLLSCGFDRRCRLVDVELGSDIKVFGDDQIINVVRFHPTEHDLFLSGGSKGMIRLWDIRTGKPEKDYSSGTGQIMDVDFSSDGKRFVSTSDMAKRHASDKAIVVWDFKSQIALSNQVYLEAYTCPCVRYHPFEQQFIAQSNANYIAIFSARPPFKMDRYKRFEGHQVAAYRIQCNFSPCGGFVVTGSADGCVYIYSYRSSKVLQKLESHNLVCTDVSYHPVLPSVMASCSWDGLINIYQ